jgi:hypothetical protein
MLVHNVFFFLKKDLDGDKITQFRLGLESLKSIQSAEAVYIGSPAEVADRPVLDKSYDFCLTVIFQDIASHDAYQADPVHQNFIGSFKDMWQQVKVYDAD